MNLVNLIVNCIPTSHRSPPDGREAVVVDRVDGFMPPAGPDILDFFVVNICLGITYVINSVVYVKV